MMRLTSPPEESLENPEEPQDNPNLDLPPDIIPDSGELELEQESTDPPAPLPHSQDRSLEVSPVFDSTVPPLESESPEKQFLPSSPNNILGQEKLNLFEGDRTTDEQ